jgi:magnesium transporter
VNQQRFDVLLDSISRLARRGAVGHALNIVEKLRPVEVAAVLRALPQREREATFSALCRRDAQKAAESLTELGPELGVELLVPLDIALVDRLMAAVPSDDAALLVAALPEQMRDQLLEQMRDDKSTDVQELLTFELETAGRIMTHNFFALHEDVTVADAIAALQRRSEEFELSYYLYVVDERNHLLGVVSMRQLLLSTPSTPLKKIMSTDVIKVTTSTDQEDVARLVANYNLIALPVVDDEHKLVGIVTVDDIIDVIREEATEDIYALAGVDADDRAHGSTVNSVRRRLPWLMTSLATSLLAAAVVNLFSRSLEVTIALAVLLPVVIAMADNAATQAMTVVVRAIGLNEVARGGWVGIVAKEALVGLVNGAAVGLAAGLAAAAWFRSLALGAAVAIALVVNTVVAGLFGTAVPILLKRLRIDPAIASSVFVITLTVVVGLLIYFMLGRVMLGAAP